MRSARKCDIIFIYIHTFICLDRIVKKCKLLLSSHASAGKENQFVIYIKGSSIEKSAKRTVGGCKSE